MTRPTRFEANQFLGDKRTQIVHDLDALADACGLDELMASEKFAAFGPDTLPEARNRGYESCPYCIAPGTAAAG